MISKIPINNFVAAVSVGVSKGTCLLDLNYGEDSTAEVDMNIVMTDAGQFVEIQGTAEKEPFSREQMDELLNLGENGVNKLIDYQKDALKGVF